MKEVFDTIVIILFVLFMIFLVAGFNKRVMERHKEKQESRK